MAIHNSRRHKYETFFGTFEGLTWVKEFDDGSFGIRLNGTYNSNVTILSYSRQFNYTLESKQRFASVEETESYLETLSKKKVTKAMSKAPKSKILNALELDLHFAVF